MATVELRNLRKNFGSFVALEGLNLSIEDGEFLVLLGPSGCGKSTTMRLVAGLEDPSDGDILIGGSRVNEIPARDRDLAMVFQNYALYPHMTVGENISYPLKIARVPKAERLRRAKDAAAKVEMDHLLTPPPGRTLRGAAPAGRASPRNRAHATALSHGRAAFKPRCQAAHRDARGAEASAKGTGHDNDLRHA